MPLHSFGEAALRKKENLKSLQNYTQTLNKRTKNKRTKNKMPNGRARQQNTAVANRRRSLQQARDALEVVEAVGISIAPVVVEAVNLQEVRAGEIVKLKKQIQTLKKRMTKMEDRDVSRRVDMAEERHELEKQIEGHKTSSILMAKGYEEEKKKNKKAEQATKKLLSKMIEALQKATEEMDKQRIFLAMMSNIAHGTDFITKGTQSHEDLEDALNGISYDDIVDTVRHDLGSLKLLKMVQRKCYEEKDREGDRSSYYVLEGKVYQIRFHEMEGEVLKNEKNEAVNVKTESLSEKEMEVEFAKMKETAKKDMNKWVVPGGCYGDY